MDQLFVILYSRWISCATESCNIRSPEGEKKWVYIGKQGVWEFGILMLPSRNLPWNLSHGTCCRAFLSGKQVSSPGSSALCSQQTRHLGGRLGWGVGCSPSLRWSHFWPSPPHHIEIPLSSLQYQIVSWLPFFSLWFYALILFMRDGKSLSLRFLKKLLYLLISSVVLLLCSPLGILIPISLWCVFLFWKEAFFFFFAF